MLRGVWTHPARMKASLKRRGALLAPRAPAAAPGPAASRQQAGEQHLDHLGVAFRGLYHADARSLPSRRLRGILARMAKPAITWIVRYAEEGVFKVRTFQMEEAALTFMKHTSERGDVRSWAERWILRARAATDGAQGVGGGASAATAPGHPLLATPCTRWGRFGAAGRPSTTLPGV